MIIQKKKVSKTLTLIAKNIVRLSVYSEEDITTNDPLNKFFTNNIPKMHEFVEKKMISPAEDSEFNPVPGIDLYQQISALIDYFEEKLKVIEQIYEKNKENACDRLIQIIHKFEKDNLSNSSLTSLDKSDLSTDSEIKLSSSQIINTSKNTRDEKISKSLNTRDEKVNTSQNTSKNIKEEKDISPKMKRDILDTSQEMLVERYPKDDRQNKRKKRMNKDKKPVSTTGLRKSITSSTVNDKKGSIGMAIHTMTSNPESIKKKEKLIN